MNLEEKIQCKVPFGTISITPFSEDLIKECLVTKRVTNGKIVKEFEHSFANLFGTKHAIAVSSGTDANTLALASLYDYDAERKDEVIVPALSFVATGNSVINAGFKPVFVDVDPKTLCIDTVAIEAKITSKTRAIMPVHLMGKPANMRVIIELANKYDLAVVEDTAEAHGGEVVVNNKFE